MTLNGLKITTEQREGIWLATLTDYPTLCAWAKTLPEAIKTVELLWKGLQATIAKAQQEAEKPRPVIKKKPWRSFSNRKMI